MNVMRRIGDAAASNPEAAEIRVENTATGLLDWFGKVQG
jgi:hypothetical protein